MCNAIAYILYIHSEYNIITYIDTHQVLVWVVWVIIQKDVVGINPKYSGSDGIL